jgi:serine/threonine-protein kinase
MDQPDPDAIAPGTVFSHWVLDDRIGGGAMGEVWKGTDRRDGSRVAVKLLNPEFGREASFRQRFEREAHVATLLKSPYTVQTLAFGREHGHYFIVMEYVQGEPVEEILERGPMPVDQVVEVAIDVARALEAAASQRIVHRDLKPSNIILSPDGVAKLVDFGIASQAAGRDAGGQFLGTVQYAAPEQQQGNVDPRTDIYALGATMFHMLAGRPAYTGRTLEEILAQHANAPFPAALLSLHPDLVIDVIRRCMQKDPDDRYQTASELANALERVQRRLEEMAITPAPQPADYRTLVPEPDEDQRRPGAGAGIVPDRPPAMRTGAGEPAGGATVVFGAGTGGGPEVAAPAPASVSLPAAPPLPPGPPPEPIGVVPAPVPAPYPERRRSGMGRVLLIALGVVVLIGAAAGGVLAVAGGGGDDDEPAGTASETPSASATTGGGDGSPSPEASPSASPDDSPAASETATEAATETATSAATDTPTTVPPTATRTPTQGTPPTATPTKPSANPVVAVTSATCTGATVTWSGFTGSESLSGVVTGSTLVNITPSPLNGNGSASAQIPLSGLNPGPHTITVTIGGVSDSANFTC